MRKLKYFVLYLILSFVSFSCNGDFVVIIADIQRIDTSGIYFKYEYLDSIYTGYFSLYVADEDFSYVDNLEIKINKNNPQEYEYLSIIRKKWDTEDNVVKIKNPDEPSYYNYHDVDIKPIFTTSTSELENDSAIYQYFLQNSETTNNIMKVGVYIIISENGKANLKQIMTKDTSYNLLINNLINKMPLFSPAVHESDTVKVTYLIEVPIFY